MGTGTIPATAQPPTAPTLPDPLGEQIRARQSALRGLAARRGLGSTYVANKPTAGVDPTLGITAGSTG